MHADANTDLRTRSDEPPPRPRRINTSGAATGPLAAWGAQTERARRNFAISGLRQPAALIRALGLVKAACARVNARRSDLRPEVAAAIEAAALAVAAGGHPEQFPLDVFQTGSGTSTNMNANEVIARLAADALGSPVHPTDDVNRCQSSNDVIPTAMHVAAVLAVDDEVLPALAHLAATIGRRIDDCGEVVKTGRTHLMDAVPLTLGQEFSGYAAQLETAIANITAAAKTL